ncbi:Ig-like domain-containing protein [Clostridium sp. SHJSY1]|uniref:Ig-like domain-containing protein n=1 Tax=Clostridium sp. SHJSY1 TaxID=2942483 RepID=UPI002874BD65|nr:Ig-like domain-containing protein [Clostridium sp. SHJSY1]MDS0524077.1 Ig-like domain-containing protein [Clostridium sp. SHJSY1]
MKRNFKIIISIFMGIVIICTLKTYANAGTAINKSDSKVHKNEIMKGVSNLNNTSNNSAKVDDILKYPEKGWNRYDDTNSLIQYTTDTKVIGWTEGYSDSGDNIDHMFYDSTESYEASRGHSVKFRINGSKFRVIGMLWKLPQSYITKYNPTKNMDILIDGTKVDNFWPICESNSNSFVEQALLYEYSFNSVGVHDVEIKLTSPAHGGIYPWYEMGLDAIDIDGQLVDSTTPITPTTQLKPVLNIETPQIGKIYTGTMPVSGYALNPSGVKSVKIYLDDKYSKDATIGGARADVEQKYQGYPGASTSGFSTSYSVNSFTLGNHTMKVQSIGNDGSIEERNLYLYVFENNILVQTTPINERIPLYRYYIYSNGAHFYTTDFSELGKGGGNYLYDGIQCYVYKDNLYGTSPLYRYYNASLDDFYYTTNFDELGNGKNGYSYVSIQCYVYRNQVNGTKPLYRYSRYVDGVHFYTTNINELGNGNDNYKYDGIACYVLGN